jgi:hypothetical protein
MSTPTLDPEISIDPVEEPPPSSVIRGFCTFPTDPPQESVLIGNALIRLGDLAFLNSSAGAGKSVLLIQASIAWPLNLPYLGLNPSRPLKILHFVGEDDESTLGQCREGLLENAKAVIGRDLKREEIKILTDYVRTDFGLKYTGKAFIQRLDDMLKEEHADLVIINPLLSYIGGDVVANASEFLREGLMPLMKGHKCASLIGHHTPKLGKNSWAEIDPTYSGIGGGEVANAPRVIFTLMPTVVDGLWVLKVSKRQTTGWTDADGNFVDHLYFRRTENRSRPAWIPVPHEEALELIEESTPAKGSAGAPVKLTAEDVALALSSGAMQQQALIDALKRKHKVGFTTIKTRIIEARGRDLVKVWFEKNLRGGKDIAWLCIPEHFKTYQDKGRK